MKFEKERHSVKKVREKNPTINFSGEINIGYLEEITTGSSDKNPDLS